MSGQALQESCHRVRVWFGSTAIADQQWAEPEPAARYAAAMERRFAGLRVTNEPPPPAVSVAAVDRS
ncbi:hypothetical protein F1D05_10220 [Kribbella qitaiheensis]|uniref:Uncharacterized protein n=1 Tax=Kribbella qitaiheensis TaxID=1544730 RepID=A0A7G6WW37_9ACTN|nr:hypothetical protein [Kribbella qitaiheensis]QNE18202.1 hypothetical protein F1D05_10220 [Kribbella qitaiheensis]